jgi:hypothetical protein
VAEWRNWQTHQTQNLAFFTERVGSTPTSATIKMDDLNDCFEQVRINVLTRFDVCWQRIGQALHDTEARILQAFYGFAESTNKRLDQTDWNLAMSTDRLGTIESRLLEVEKRLNIPPAQ